VEREYGAADAMEEMPKANYRRSGFSTLANQLLTSRKPVVRDNGDFVLPKQ